jgi:hypothetical protein
MSITIKLNESLPPLDQLKEAETDLIEALDVVQGAINLLSPPVDRAVVDYPQPNPTMSVSVKSDSSPEVFYTVTQRGNTFTCTCPHFTFSGQVCKHIKRVKGE